MFWELERSADGRAILTEGAEQAPRTYAELLEQVTAVERRIRSDGKRLLTLFGDNSVPSLTAYLAGLRAGHAVMLVNAATDASLKARLITLYAPEWIVDVDRERVPEGYEAIEPVAGLAIARALRPCESHIDPATAVLLSTSGSTGSPKFARLSYRNVQSNAEAIVEYLGITPEETAITSLPLSYSYGLSVVNSHLLAGASLACTNASVVTQDFWSAFTTRKCTSFAGVPFSYALLEKLRFERMQLPSLRTLTQAGGRMPPDKMRRLAEVARLRALRLVVMYGQTEATARISYLPCERIHDKLGSVGIAIPGGRLRIESESGDALDPHEVGELVYEGPNVMLGYAHSREALANGDELAGRLRTGDLGYRDAEGFFYVTGRRARFVKLFGLRVNLDDVEKMLEAALGRPVACVGKDDDLHVVVESDDPADVATARQRVVALYKIHHSVVHAHGMIALPHNLSGKKDYAAITRELD